MHSLFKSNKLSASLFFTSLLGGIASQAQWTGSYPPRVIFQFNCNKKSLSGKNLEEPLLLDTHASLLYKLGITKEAIKAGTKAFGLAPDNDRNSYIETIGKMKKGKNTWTE